MPRRTLAATDRAKVDVTFENSQQTRSGRVVRCISDLGYTLFYPVATDFSFVVSQYLILVQLYYQPLSEPDVRR